MKNKAVYLLAACAAAVALCTGDAAAQTLYKLIDKNGKVTYSESRPKEFDGQVVPLNIDPNANTATLPKPKAAAPEVRNSDSDGPPRKAGPSRDERVQAAKEKLAAAKKALQDATDSSKEEDFRWLGTASGGTRRVPTEDHQKRIADLEQRVKDAERDLKVAEEG